MLQIINFRFHFYLSFRKNYEVSINRQTGVFLFWSAHLVELFGSKQSRNTYF